MLAKGEPTTMEPKDTLQGRDCTESTGKWVDPMVSILPGTRFILKTIEFELGPDMGSGDTSEDFGGAMLSVISSDKGVTHVWGSAYLIAPGIALTAYHVIEAYKSAGIQDKIELSGHVGEELRMWQVHEFHVPRHCGDTAIMTLHPRFELYDGILIQVFRVSARIPLVGERVGAVGYVSKSREGFPQSSKLPLHTFVGRASVGEVESVDDRDADLSVRWRDGAPCLQTTIDTIPSMSGGPVFDKFGHVIGTISTAMTHEDPPGCTTWADLPWGSFFFEFEPAFPNGIWPPRFRLHPTLVHQAYRLSLSNDGILTYQAGD